MMIDDQDDYDDHLNYEYHIDYYDHLDHDDHLDCDDHLNHGKYYICKEVGGRTQASRMLPDLI